MKAVVIYCSQGSQREGRDNSSKGKVVYDGASIDGGGREEGEM